MNRIFLFLTIFSLVCCVPSQIHTETVEYNTDRRWLNCSFYVVDHECGMISNEETRDECAINAQADYLSQSEGRQRFWLHQHGCPSHVVNPI